MKSAHARGRKIKTWFFAKEQREETFPQRRIERKKRGIRLLKKKKK